MSLTVDEFKAIVTTTASDEAIALALASAEEAIVNAVGPEGQTLERIRGGDDQIMLGRRALSILSVSEISGTTRTVLDPSDYELSQSGAVVRRLNTGPNPSWRWIGSVEISYLPTPSSATRDQVQAELAALDVGASLGSAQGALSSQRIGEFSETFATTAVAQRPEDRRASVLARLDEPRVIFWVGSGGSSIPSVTGS